MTETEKFLTEYDTLTYTIRGEIQKHNPGTLGAIVAVASVNDDDIIIQNAGVTGNQVTTAVSAAAVLVKCIIEKDPEKDDQKVLETALLYAAYALGKVGGQAIYHDRK